MAAKLFPPIKNIFQTIQTLAGQNEKLDITRSFQGLNLKQCVTITKVDDDKIYLRVSDCQIFTYPDGPIYIQDKRISNPIRGSFHLDNLSTGIVVLSELNWMDRKWKNRTKDRVQPKNTVYIDVEYQNNEIRARLENISTSGMAVLINKSFNPLIHIDSLRKILLSFTLLPGCEFRSLAGSLVYRQAFGPNLIRLGVRFIPSFEELNCLKSYISQRKLEILNELGHFYRDFETRIEVTNLYF
jgi:hypothetical protein